MRSPLFWELGLAFMYIPGNLVFLYLLFCDCERDRWREGAVWCALHPLWVIINSLDTGFKTLRGEVTERNIENTKLFKLVEIIGERQCCIKTSGMFSDMFYYINISYIFTGESLPQAVLR